MALNVLSLRDTEYQSIQPAGTQTVDDHNRPSFLKNLSLVVVPHTCRYSVLWLGLPAAALLPFLCAAVCVWRYRLAPSMSYLAL